MLLQPFRGRLTNGALSISTLHRNLVALGATGLVVAVASIVLRFSRKTSRSRAESRPLHLSRSGSAFYAVNPINVVRDRVVIAMVGLPARGKSYMSKAIIRYLNFIGCPAKNFNAGNKRRNKGLAGTGAAFFGSGNAEAKRAREAMAMETLDDLLAWLQSVECGSACGIFDATNTTVARRQAVMRRCAQEDPPVQLVFFESICDDDAMLQNNYRMKLANEDYVGAEAAKALADFKERVAAYEAVYETIADDEADTCFADDNCAEHGGVGGVQAAATGGRVAAERDADARDQGDGASGADGDGQGGGDGRSEGGRVGETARKSPLPLHYVKTINAGRKLVSKECEGHVLTHALTLLQSIHLVPRRIAIVLAGQSHNDAQGIRGGDTPLSSAGLKYARAACQLALDKLAAAAETPTSTGASASASLPANAPTASPPSTATAPAAAAAAATAAAPVVLTGTLQRYVQMAALLEPRAQLVLNLKPLNELCFGALEGLRCGKLQDSFPLEYAARLADKLNYRYPGVGGESYTDMIIQLRDVVLAIERTRADVIVVCDVAAARVLLGYFQGIPHADIPEIEIEQGVIELARSHSGFSCTHTRVDVGTANSFVKR
uniref:6-phosphofructo-2-kinase domain-containing protein n=1 Tax=Chrysotila carterae TaxID=13221 RepID=A0A7S4B9A0_CHRCT|mmetsp:Transcript_19859/g.42871  ORF Transcript_19859/g.42871 Transcript_19859/m.42871 type:complete len:608 (+) Transcript_19859:134-1957(+)